MCAKIPRLFPMSHSNLQESMRGTLVLIFQALLWPAISVSGLFTVNVQKSSYEAELHGDVELVCVFSDVKQPSNLTVIWTRINPKPDVDVYRLEKGRENQIYTNDAFKKRAQLIQEQLKENRAVLHLKKLQIKDSGTYRCIVKEGDEGDYKQVTLNVTAPYTPIKKSVRKTGQDEVELSCESQGFPSPQVFWSDGQNTNLTETSKSSTLHTDEDVVKVFSTLTVRRDLVNNYTCSFLRSGEVQQTASFSIPDEVHHECSAQYAWIGAVVIVLLAITFIYVILRRRSNAGTSLKIKAASSDGRALAPVARRGVRRLRCIFCSSASAAVHLLRCFVKGHFLLPAGGTMTVGECRHVDLFNAGLLSNVLNFVQIWAFTAKLLQLPVSWRIFDATDTPIDENAQIAQLYIVNAFRRHIRNVMSIRLKP
ncbi:CD276 antigen [Pimephales promelas]|nr:CD276 antigen [Pimephales promelas]